MCENYFYIKIDSFIRFYNRIARIRVNKLSMKHFIIKVSVAIATALLLVLAFHKIGALKEENARLKSNQEILLTENKVATDESQKYKVLDSLNAVKTSQLELALKEYKKHRSEDLKLINQLKLGKSDLQRVITSQSETINSLSAKLSDTIRVNSSDNSVDTFKYFSYKSKWTDVNGYIDLKCDSLSIHVKNRESLKVVETVLYKRFLGFLWKTSKVKSRQVDIISENPSTEIINCEYISIKQ